MVSTPSLCDTDGQPGEVEGEIEPDHRGPVSRAAWKKTFSTNSDRTEQTDRPFPLGGRLVVCYELAQDTKPSGSVSGRSSA